MRDDVSRVRRDDDDTARKPNMLIHNVANDDEEAGAKKKEGAGEEIEEANKTEKRARQQKDRMKIRRTGKPRAGHCW